jgi:hypothetical protein
MSLGPTVETSKLIPNVNYPVSLYAAESFSLGAGLQTGSPSIDVRPYSTKTVYAFIGTQQNGSGSIVVSGSFDNTTWYNYLVGDVFNSGSTGSKFNIDDVVPYLQVSLLNKVVASAITGSLFLEGRI